MLFAPVQIVKQEGVLPTRPEKKTGFDLVRRSGKLALEFLSRVSTSAKAIAGEM